MLRKEIGPSLRQTSSFVDLVSVCAFPLLTPSPSRAEIHGALPQLRLTQHLSVLAPEDTAVVLSPQRCAISSPLFDCNLPTPNCMMRRTISPATVMLRSLLIQRASSMPF